MSYFRDSSEVESIYVAFIERFLESSDGERALEASSALTVPAVLNLHLTSPDATLSVDLAERSVVPAAAPEASVQLEIEASALHDILLDRLDPVQISRLFEEDRAAIEGRPEALTGLIKLVGLLARHYPESLAEQRREDLLATPEPPRSTVWRSEGPPKLMIGRRRPWQRPKVSATH